jgi:hypothetical protein
MAFDFKDRSLPRHPANYLPADLNLVDGIAVDVYDKGKADAQGNGKTFAQLMEPAEQFARDMGLPIYITEAGAPDTGQWGRRDGWKPAWYVGAWAHMNDSYLLDGQPLYRSFLPFNSHIGDPPPAVTGPPPIKAGWYSDTTEEARLAYVDILQRSQAW